MQALTNDYRALFTGVVIYGKGDLSHQDHPSDHNEDDIAGSKPAQNDADSVPEHRAIDVMLGPAFSRAQALATIALILADPNDRKRLRYINFETTQWHRDNNFAPMPNPDDPHPTHIHFSQQAAFDDDASPWLRSDMFEQADRNTAQADTWRLLTILEDREAAEFSIQGESAPRREVNRLRERLVRIEEAVTSGTVTLSEEQLDLLASKVADRLTALRFVAE